MFCGLTINFFKFHYFGFWEDQAALELAALLGVLLFHAQHTFTELRRKSDISYLEQGLLGSLIFEVIFNFFKVQPILYSRRSLNFLLWELGYREKDYCKRSS